MPNNFKNYLQYRTEPDKNSLQNIFYAEDTSLFDTHVKGKMDDAWHQTLGSLLISHTPSNQFLTHILKYLYSTNQLHFDHIFYSSKDIPYAFIPAIKKKYFESSIPETEIYLTKLANIDYTHDPKLNLPYHILCEDTIVVGDQIEFKRSLQESFAYLQCITTPYHQIKFLLDLTGKVESSAEGGKILDAKFKEELQKLNIEDKKDVINLFSSMESNPILMDWTGFPAPLVTLPTQVYYALEFERKILKYLGFSSEMAENLVGLNTDKTIKLHPDFKNIAQAEINRIELNKDFETKNFKDVQITKTKKPKL